ncbi:MAG: phosphatase PAP2 family protein [Candidatus Lokiarchaeota archaeon]|nr:phosphatase PAP2 family protein [Candidatus Lokiarchaeota archaeon]MBD3340977.1 phosphatase PAP2 family protein [Candidatus Lokiarchaeota archaeon]
MKLLNKILLIILEVWIILAVIFGIYDLEISKVIVDTHSPIGLVGTIIGYYVRDSLIIIIITILGGSFFHKNVQREIGFFLLAISVLILIYNILKPDGSLIFSFILIGFVLGFIILTYNTDWKNFVQIAIIVLLLYISFKVILDLTKLIFGRVRFKHLDSNYSNYTQWYIINGVESDNQSFPSGHSMYSWLFLPFLILLRRENLNKYIKIIVASSVIGYGFFISIARVLIGGHYCSDVLFSTCIACTLCILFYKKISNIERLKILEAWP